MVKVILPESDTLGSEEKLSDEQLREIETIKTDDWVKTDQPKSEEEPKKELEKKPTEEESKPGKTPEEIEKEKEEQDLEALETARLEKKAKEFDKTVEEIQQIEAGEKTEKERLEKIAKEEGRTVEEIKAEEEKDRNVAERHGNDPIKLARALRKEQSGYEKQKDEVEQLRRFKEQADAQIVQFNEQQLEERMEKGREDIIEKYRDKFPGEETDKLSDDVVFERGKGIIRKALEERQKVRTEKIKADAETKRIDLVKNLPEEFKDFIPEIKKLLEECGDSQILDKEFDISYLGNYIRGKKFTPDYVKSSEEAFYKRGVEQAKIIPKVPQAKPGSDKTITVTLTDSQKNRAEEMYGRREGWTRQRMWEEYFKSDLKEDSKW